MAKSKIPVDRCFLILLGSVLLAAVILIIPALLLFDAGGSPLDETEVSKSTKDLLTRYQELQQEKLLLQQSNLKLQKEVESLQDLDVQFDLTRVDERSADLILTELERSAERRSEQIESLLSQGEVGDSSVTLLRDAQKANAQLQVTKNLLEVAHRQVVVETSPEANPSWSSILTSREFALTWLLGILVTLFVVAGVAQDKRRLIRKRMRPRENKSASKNNKQLTVSAAIVIFALVSVTCVGCSYRRSEEETRAELDPRIEKLNSELEKENSILKAQEEQLKEEHAQLLEEVTISYKIKHDWQVNELQLPNTDSLNKAKETQDHVADVEASIASADEKAIRLLREKSTRISVAEDAVSQADLELDGLENGLRVIDEFQGSQRSLNTKVFIAKLSIMATFLLLNVGLVFRWSRTRNKQQAEIEATCPQCLSTDQLEDRTNPNPDVRNPGHGTVHCKECGYEMRPNFRKTLRTYFPTIGFRASGKTLWLCMFHHQVKFGQANTPLAKFERANSLGTTDEAFDASLEAVMNQHSPAATPVATEVSEPLTFPLVFRFTDGDKCQNNSASLNLFDYGGYLFAPEAFEMTGLRERAMEMDGFLLFIDPRTKEAVEAQQGYLTPEQEETLPTVEQQNELFRNFRDQIRQAKDIAAGKPINLPVAVCVTKLDLLYKDSDSDDGSGSVFREFSQQVQTINVSEEEPTLDTIRQHHELFLSYRPNFFPGWELEQQLEQDFGGQYMFFPVTSVGFGEPGVEDLKRRSLDPFGTLEPMLWLLHMNGFQSLRK